MDDLDQALIAPKIAAGHDAALRGRALALRAGALRRRNQRRLAGLVYQQALALSPEDGWIHARVSTYFVDVGKFQAALAAAQMAVDGAENDEDLAVALAARGIAVWFLGHHDAAVSDWIAAAELARPGDPTHVSAVYNLAADLARRRDPGTAAAALELVATVREKLGHREALRVRAMLRWVTGLAEAIRGRRYAARRQLIRALRQMARTRDIAAAVLIAADLAALTGAAVDAAKVAAEAGADPETVERVRGMAAALEGGETGRRAIAAEAVVSLCRSPPSRRRRGRPP